MKQPAGDEGITDWDTLWRRVRPFGKWQIAVVALLAASNFFSATCVLLQSFAGTKMQHFCRIPQLANLTEWQQLQLAIPSKAGKFDSCTYYDLDYDILRRMRFQEAVEERNKNREWPSPSTRECDAWIFNTTAAAYGSSIQKDFNLVCNRQFLLPTAQTLVMLGIALGALVFGSLSDRFGRRPTALCSFTLAFFVSLAISLARSYAVFVVLRLLQAFLLTGVGLSTYVLALEVVGSSKWRGRVGQVLFLPFSLGYMSIPLVAKWWQEWRELNVVLTLPSVVFFFMFCFLPESPRWLASKRRYAEADALLHRCARVNGILPPLGRRFSVANIEADAVHGERESYLQMIAHGRLAWRALLVSFGWLANAGLYYGLAFYVMGIGGTSVYVSFFLGGLVELPAFALSAWLYSRFGRRNPLACTMAINGCLLLVIFVKGAVEGAPTGGYIVMALATLGKLCVTASFSMISIFSAELYPTTVRTAAMGVSSASARIGSGAAPYLQHLGDTLWAPLTPLIFAALAFLAAVASWLLPETREMPMPQTIDDALRLGDDEQPSASNVALVEKPETL